MSTEEQAENSRNRAEHLAPHQFTPGQCGNPGGRPKGRSLTARLREIMDREAASGKDYGDLIMEVLVKSAGKGNIKAISMLLDRVDGKVIQQFKIENTNKSYDTNNTPEHL